MTATGKFAIANAAISGMAIKLYLVDHMPLKVLAMAIPATLVVINLAVWYGVRSAARRARK
jgi:hypothetical protein